MQHPRKDLIPNTPVPYSFTSASGLKLQHLAFLNRNQHIQEIKEAKKDNINTKFNIMLLIMFTPL